MVHPTKILITGGSGFFGKHLTQRLLQQLENRITILDLQPPPKRRARRVKYIQADITNKDDVLAACKDQDIVYHTAALVPISRAGDLFRKVNVEGTRNILEACLQNNVQKVVYLSSSSVYGIPAEFPLRENSPLRPFGEYALTKLEAEEVCFHYMKRGLPVCILRPRTIVGEGRLGIVAVLFDWIHYGKKVYLLGTGENYYQLISPTDLAEVCVLAVTHGMGEVINVGTDNYKTLREDFQELVDYAGSGSKIVLLPAWVVKSTLWLLNKFNLSPFVHWHYMTLDKNYAFDISKAKSLLKWKPKKSNAQCLKEAYAWYLTNHKELKTGKDHQSVPPQKLIKVIRFLS